MGWNGSGDFTRSHNFSADASAGIKILATRQDAEWSNFETGLENCVTRDGQNSPTADLPMGGQKHTNVAAATSVTQYMRVDQYLRQIPIYAALGGTPAAMSASTVLALTSMTAGVQILVSAASVASTSVTLALNGQSAFPVRLQDGSEIHYGDLRGLNRYVFNGEYWAVSPTVDRYWSIFCNAALNQVNVSTSATATVGFSASISRVNFWGTSADYPATHTGASFIIDPARTKIYRAKTFISLNADDASGGVQFTIYPAGGHGPLVHGLVETMSTGLNKQLGGYVETAWISASTTATMNVVFQLTDGQSADINGISYFMVEGYR